MIIAIGGSIALILMAYIYMTAVLSSGLADGTENFFKSFVGSLLISPFIGWVPGIVIHLSTNLGPLYSYIAGCIGFALLIGILDA